MWAPKLRTPGMARSSLLTAVVVRTVSASEVLGTPTQCIRKSRSWKAGNRLCPSPEPTTTPTSATTAVAAYTRRGRTTIRRSAAV